MLRLIIRLNMHKKTNQKLNQKGFTLIEFLLYMALLSIFMLTLSEMFVSILELQTESEGLSFVEEDGRFILARLTNDINNASSISTPAAPGNTSDTLVLVLNGVQNTYSIQSNNLAISNPQGSANLNSSGSNVTAINFLRLGVAGKDSIKISFTIQGVSVGNSGPETRTFNTTVTRR